MQIKRGRKFCHRGRAEGRASPVIHRTPCKNPVIAKPVRTLAVAIRSPRPSCRGITDSHDQSADWSRNDTQILSASVIARAQGARGNPHPPSMAPLPKGGCHGEAVTGGFLSRTPGRAHGPCPTKCVGDPCVPPQQGHPHPLNRKAPSAEGKGRK